MAGPADIYSYEDAQSVVTEILDKAHDTTNYYGPQDSLNGLYRSWDKYHEARDTEEALKLVAHILGDEKTVRQYLKDAEEREDKNHG